MTNLFDVACERLKREKTPDMVEAIADKLVEDHISLLAENAALRKVAEDAQAQRDKLAVAFDKYGQHFKECINTKDNSCNCGFISVYYEIRRMKECGK
jgi:hypothetical protein